VRPLGWRAWLAALALLILGAAAGVAVDRLHHRTGGPLSKRIAEVHRDPLGLMERELQLSPDQRARIAVILERRQGTLDAFWEDTHVRLRATVDSTVSEIAAELDSSQAERFRRMADEIHSSPGFLPRRGQ
jgi:hypothetical protein